MPITFERNICCNFDETVSREWLITNGLGGYASGTVAGTLTRTQQGLLVAALDEDVAPQLLLAKIDEEVHFDQRTYYLGTNEYQDGTLNPAGFVHLESFRLEEGFPIFTYRLGGIDGFMLEKRIWMPQGQNTTCIQYRVLRRPTTQQSLRSMDNSWRNGGQPGYNSPSRSYNSYLEGAQPSLTLTLLPFVAHRPYNQAQRGQHDQQFQVQTHQQESAPHDPENMAALALPPGIAGCTIRAEGKTTPYHLLAIGHAANQAQFIPTGVWYWRFQHRHEQAAGLPASDDLYLPGVIRARLWPDKDVALTIIVTTEELTTQPFNQKQLNRSYEQALDYQRNLLQTRSYFGEGGAAMQAHPVLPLTDHPDTSIKNEEFLQLLHQAGDQLLIQRTLPYREHSTGSSFFLRAAEHIPTVVPGYYNLEDTMREALISLPGLTITTHRYSEAQRILRHIARYFKQGLLPNRLPTEQRPNLEASDYSNVDTTLWYFSALDKYLSATHDYELLEELYLRLENCISWYNRGTMHGIGVDAADGLLRTGASNVALTWMNASIDGEPVTPRSGKPVEVNALWYHALSLIQEWSQLLNQRGHSNQMAQKYAEQKELCWRSFHQRFWYQEGSYLYDVVDGPEGNDARLRPNQLLAISLRHAILQENKQKAVLDVVTRQLLAPAGLRTLAPRDPAYQGVLPENQRALQSALHQGSVWPWLIGPYVDALLKADRQPSRDGATETYDAGRVDVYKERAWLKALQILEPFRQLMEKHLLGSISRTYSGNAPYEGSAHPQLASAISVGEILRIYKVLTHMGIQYSDQILSA
jgi:glycogen debranching enzyme